MAQLASSLAGEAGLRLLLSPLGSNVVVRTACCSVGIVFPVYSTFKAIEGDSAECQKQWLIYWTVYGGFSIVDIFSDKILSWFPLYNHVKLAFLVWLQLPATCGSRQLYLRCLRPLLLENQTRLDQIVTESTTEMVGLHLLLSPLGSNVVVQTARCSVGIVFPVYSTFKAIERNNAEQRKQWLIYWAVYGGFSIVEIFSDKLLSWFCFYNHVKLAFLVWLQLPANRGSRQLYLRYLRPLLLKHQRRLDSIVAGTITEMNRLLLRHQLEIRVMKAVLQKCFEAAYQVVQYFLGRGMLPHVILELAYQVIQHIL